MDSVKLQGRIVDINRKRNVTIFTLSIKGEKENNYPRVVFRNDDDSIRSYDVGDHVKIDGTIKTQRLKNDDGKTYFAQFVRGIFILHAGTEMSEKFGYNLGGMYTYENEVLIKGEIVYTRRYGRAFNFFVQPDGEKFVVRLSTFVPESLIDEYLSKYKKGATICAKCELQTAQKKNSTGMKNQYEDLIIKYSDTIKFDKPQDDTDIEKDSTEKQPPA